ncbi:MAG: ABC transporter ATP-binding protein/permease [Dorea sp.]|nr:ABC transporter ATP-binding protein/permease [Dorea sp.]
MRNIVRFLSTSKRYVLLIVALLAFQAYCDLALPGYTSDLLNVGLQQGGIEDAVPETIREESMNAVKMFLQEEDVDLLEASYEAGTEESLFEGADTTDGNIYLLKEDADHEALNKLLLVPESIVFQMTQSEEGKAAFEQIQMALASGMMTKEQLFATMEERMGQMEGLTDTYLKQIATAFVKAEYEAQGRDMNAIRNHYLFIVGGKMMLMALLMSVLAILTGLVASVVSARIGRDLREKMFARVMSFTSAEMEKFSTASLITRCTNDIQQIQFVTVMLLRMVAYAPILAVCGIVKVLNIGSEMSWTIVVAVIALGLCMVILLLVAYPKFKIMQVLVDNVNLVSREMLTGIMPIRAFTRQEHEEARFDQANTKLYKTQLFTNRTMNFMMPVMMLIMNGVSVLIVWVGGHGVDEGNVQIGDLTAFITYSMVIIMSFLILSMVSILLPRAGVAADRIVEVLNTEVSLKDPEHAEDDKLTGEGVLEYHDVSFTYPDADEPVIQNISFKAEPGKTTAIIGSTGCGKSTLIHLIPRFYDVTKGSITLDGIDLRKLTQEKLRDQIGYVPQKGVLFSGTIESNLKYASDEITDEEMKEAAEIAQAMEFIETKEEKFDSAIAQNGTNVSGGQKQRLSIARAIAKHPKIFVFDDSFSALDYKTDAALRKELSEKTKDATVIIVAQRISTIMNAEQILVMDEGKIVGKGTHRELLLHCPTYMEIARGQLSEAEIAQALKGGEPDGRN